MTRRSRRFSPRIETLLVSCVVLVVLATFGTDAAAQSANCNRARAIVDDARALYESRQPDYKSIILKLRTAQELCPTYGEAWKYAHCCARAMGDDTAARLYRDRALFNDVSSLDCAGIGGTPAHTVAKRSSSSYVRQKYALLIGIGKFADAEHIRPLKYPAKDVRDLARALTDPQSGHFRPENITLLVDEHATRAAILGALQQLFLQAQEDDLVVVYVSSHGSPAAQDEGLAGIGYILTHDTAVRNVWVDAIEYQDFSQKTAMIRARRKVVILDTCYSGLARAGAKELTIEPAGVDERTARSFLSGEGSVVITSSRSTEQSWESDRLENSYFTYYLMEALRRPVDESPPTIANIFEYLSPRVADAVAREQRESQHPQIMAADEAGDIRIGVAPRATTSAGGGQ